VHDPPRITDFRRVALAADGYEGWTTFGSLHPRRPDIHIPPAGGTYVVLRVKTDEPVFLRANPAGLFKGRDPTVSLAHLEANWVDKARVLYIGKAENLDTRVRAMAAFGAGTKSSHFGGRIVWQLEEAPTLLVAWRHTRFGFEHPLDDEDDMIRRFRTAYGKSPFANRPHLLGR
jgi:hypothetical protein